MTKPGPGKFEHNNSLEESEILYKHSLDGSHEYFGETENYFGWNILILGDTLTELEKTVCTFEGYICREDSYGFFYVIPFSKASEAVRQFEAIQEEYYELFSQPYVPDYMDES